MRHYANQPIGTVPRARHLRREASAPERRLLRALRQAFPHLKWRHQTPLGPFYADILCFSEWLVIEVDGDTHDAADGYDARRTAFIEREDYRVIRFGNRDVMDNLDSVLTMIAKAIDTQKGRS